MKRWYLAVAGVSLLLVSAAACGTGTAKNSTKVASGTKNLGTFTMATEPWLGYGPWYIAQDKGYFAKQGLHVKLLNFTEDAPTVAAVASGKADGNNAATNTWLADMPKFPVKAVMLLDQSNTADAVIAGKDIKSLSDLRGKTVAFEQGTTSDILLHYALSQANIPFSAIKPVHIPAAQAGSALVSGKVAAAVTYEPYISAAVAHGGYHRIYTAGEDPGLISDVLYVRQAVIDKRPEQITALVKAWDEAVAYLHSNPTDGEAIIAKAVGAPVESLQSAFKGVTIYSAQKGQDLVTSTFPKTYEDIATAARQAGLLKARPPAFKEAFDDTFLSAVVNGQ